MSNVAKQYYTSGMAQVDIYAQRARKRPARFTDYAKALPQLEFQPQWLNPKSYTLEAMINATVGLVPGELRGFKDSFGRVGVLSCTPWGNVVGYQAHRGHCDQVHVDAPTQVVAIYGRLITGWVNHDTQEVLFGLNDVVHIGETLARQMASMRK